MGTTGDWTITQVEGRGWRRIVEAWHLICSTEIKSCPVSLVLTLPLEIFLTVSRPASAGWLLHIVTCDSAICPSAQLI